MIDLRISASHTPSFRQMSPAFCRSNIDVHRENVTSDQTKDFKFSARLHNRNKSFKYRYLIQTKNTCVKIGQGQFEIVKN